MAIGPTVSWEEAIQRRAEMDKAIVKGMKVMRLVATVTEAALASGEQVPTRDFVAVTVLAEATALWLLDTAAAAETAEQTAASFVGRPDAEPLVEALRRHAASLERLRTQAVEFAATTRRMASLPVVEEEHESSDTRPGEEGVGFAPGVQGSDTSARSGVPDSSRSIPTSQ